MSTLTPTRAYAAITLGSNSFNMLVARTVGNKPTVIAKYKRKVRLAEGIGEDGILSEEVMLRGLDCLAMFAGMLKQHGISGSRVAVLATATLRVIANADEFHQRAFPVLGHKIDVISGLREAELIYLGMCSTTQGEERRLVIDIGGASTEFIVGEGKAVQFKVSVPMGCVLFNQRFFNQAPLQLIDFEQAKAHIASSLGDYRHQLIALGWHNVVGASGAVQSVVSLLQYRQQSEVISLDVLKSLKDEILAQSDLSLSGIKGLTEERAPTFASGVAILLGLFELLSISTMHLAGGALREGVLQVLADRLKAEIN